MSVFQQRDHLICRQTPVSDCRKDDHFCCPSTNATPSDGRFHHSTRDTQFIPPQDALLDSESIQTITSRKSHRSATLAQTGKFPVSRLKPPAPRPVIRARNQRQRATKLHLNLSSRLFLQAERRGRISAQTWPKGGGDPVGRPAYGETPPTVAMGSHSAAAASVFHTPHSAGSDYLSPAVTSCSGTTLR